MEILRQLASGLMLLSGMTHTAHFLFWEASPTNTPSAAVFGGCYLAVGVLLLRRGSLGLWLGGVVGGVGAVLGSLVALANPSALGFFHAAINWVVFPICIVLLVRRPRVPQPEA